MAWYEETGPTFDDAFKAIKTKVKSEEMADEEIKVFIQEQIDTYGGLGSWRGFGTFVIPDLMERINKKIVTNQNNKPE